jgi:hypothetical protein
MLLPSTGLLVSLCCRKNGLLIADSESGFGHEAVQFYVVLRDGGPLHEGQWKWMTKVLKISG